MLIQFPEEATEEVLLLKNVTPRHTIYCFGINHNKDLRAWKLINTPNGYVWVNLGESCKGSTENLDVHTGPETAIQTMKKAAYTQELYFEATILSNFETPGAIQALSSYLVKYSKKAEALRND